MHATVVPHGQTGAQIESGSPRSPSPAARRRGAELRRAAPPPVPLFALSRQILVQRARLDLNPSLSEPPDLDPTDQIRAYPFAWAFC